MRLLLLLILTAIAGGAAAIGPDRHVRSAPEEVTVTGRDSFPRLYTNPLGNSYYLLPNARLVTDNPLNNQVFSFYDSSLGAPDHIDVTNPFEIIVYYRDYAHLILLDRTLSELQRIDINDFEDLQQAGAVARGLRNEIWVFDDWDYHLKQIDGSGSLREVTNDLRIRFRLTTPPDVLLVSGTTVGLLLKEENRLLLFENTGRFLREVPLPPADYYGWVAPRLLGLPDGMAPGWLWTMDGGLPRTFTPPGWLTANRSPLPGKDGIHLLDSVGQRSYYQTWKIEPREVSKN